jgi:hypothetical protein
MSKTTVHPRLKTSIIEELEQELYRPSNHRLRVELTAIVDENSLAHNNNEKAIRFHGRVYSCPGYTVTYPRSMNKLDPALLGRFKAYLKRDEALTAEKALTIGYFQKVTTTTNYLDDYYLLIPEMLHNAIGKWGRHLIQGEGKFSKSKAEEFMQANEKYVSMIKARLSSNILGFW